MVDSNGFLNINKPPAITSHDVVARVRRLAKETIGKTKVGHAGTLDPLATGVLVICLGSATRLSEYAMQSQKTYRARVHLGITTDTYDADGEITAEQPLGELTQATVKALLPDFQGEIEQVPPMYSAIKQGGKKLYELARAGQTVERKRRQITIYNIQLSDWQPPQFTLTITCSPGTYIRSIAHDMGVMLGVGAHLAALVRTQSGSFQVGDAVNLDELREDPQWHHHLIAPADALADWQRLTLTPQQATDVMQGRRIARTTTLDDEFVLALMIDGYLLAVLRNEGKMWKPHKVFLPQSS